MTYAHNYSGVSNPANANTAKTTEWRGTNSGNFQTAANWTNGAPGDGDTLIWNSGSVDVDAGLTNTGLDGLILYFHPNWTGSMDGLVIGSASKIVIRKRTGTLSIDANVTTGVHILDTAAGSAAVTLTATSPDTIKALHLHGTSGQVVVAASSRATTVNVIPHQGNRATLSVGASATMTTLRGGRNAFVTTASGATTHYASGPSVHTLTGSAAPTTLQIGNGAKVEHESTGTITQLNLRSEGRIDLRDNEESSVTITDMEMLPGSVAALDSGLDALTITNGIAYYGGDLVPDRGSTVAVT